MKIWRGLNFDEDKFKFNDSFSFELFIAWARYEVVVVSIQIKFIFIIREFVLKGELYFNGEKVMMDNRNTKYLR